jgi:hypothetical protein
MGHENYTYLVVGLLSGKVIDEVDLSSFSFQEILNRAGSGQATARIESPTTTENNFLPWGNALYALRGDHVIWGGIIGDVQPRADSRVINIPLFGFMEYYHTQPINTTVQPWNVIHFPPNEQFEYAVAYGGHEHKSAVVFGAVDQYRIFEDLIMHVARRDPLSDINASVQYDELSGVLRSDTWYNYEYKMVGEACEQLADRENGFDWHYRYYLDVNSPGFFFFLHPRCGTRPITLEWDADPIASNLANYDLAGATKPKSTVIVIGEGEASNSKFARIDAASTDDTGGRPRYYEIVSMTDIKVQATLQAHADKIWLRNALPRRDARVTLAINPEDEFLNFESGNQLYLRVDDHGIQVNKLYKVTTRQWVVTKEGNESITVDLEEI